LEVIVTTISPSEKLLKTVCGSCLILAPALLLVGGLLHPEETTDATRQFEIIAANVGRWELSHWIISASMLLMMGAVVGLAHVLHDRRPSEGIIGGAVTMIGVMALFAVATSEAAIMPQLARPDPVDAVQIFERIYDSGARWVLLIPVMLLPLGLIVMSYGLYRAGVTQTWVAGSVAVGSLGFAVSLPTGSPVAFGIGLALLFVGLARVGWGVLTETDDQWHHPPQVGAKPAG
jgi:hypothetical protein